MVTDRKSVSKMKEKEEVEDEDEITVFINSQFSLSLCLISLEKPNSHLRIEMLRTVYVDPSLRACERTPEARRIFGARDRPSLSQSQSQSSCDPHFSLSENNSQPANSQYQCLSTVLHPCIPDIWGVG
jgi:hypothetical protein